PRAGVHVSSMRAAPPTPVATGQWLNAGDHQAGRAGFVLPPAASPSAIVDGPSSSDLTTPATMLNMRHAARCPPGTVARPPGSARRRSARSASAPAPARTGAGHARAAAHCQPTSRSSVARGRLRVSLGTLYGEDLMA